MADDESKTLWCGNLSESVTEELLYELFLQAGPLEKVKIPKDRDGRQKSFAFITYSHAVSVPYAINLFRGTTLFHRTLSLQSRGRVVPLPPPIRCYGPEQPITFPPQNNFAQQFAEMTENLRDDAFKPVNKAVQMNEYPDRLHIASLQGNWSHRHHPYRPKDKYRDDFRPREREPHGSSNRNKHSGNWRDRRNHRSYHR